MEPSMRNFAVALLLATTVAVAVLAFSAPAFAAPTDGRGNNTIEDRSTGAPDNPDGFGSVASQRALDEHGLGPHVRDQSKPHLGLGNVAANDGALFTITGLTDTGTRPGDHAAAIGELSGYPAINRPGTREP